MTFDFRAGDPVWAKMKGYPPWPATIEDPPKDSKAKRVKSSYVKFFGTGDYAWISHDNIYPHYDQILREAKFRKKTSAAYKEAVDAIARYSETYKRKNVSNLQKCKERPSTLNIKNSPFSKLPKLNKPKKTNNKNPKNVKPSDKHFGFIGLGMMGKRIVEALLDTGHKVSIWNRTAIQCEPFIEMGAERACHPADLIVHCDIVFNCVSDLEATKAIIFGIDGILQGLQKVQELGLTKRKGFVEMTTIDPDTSQKHSEIIQFMKNIAYLEAPIYGSTKDAEEGNLMIFAAGNCILFKMCESCFHAIAKHAFYLSCDVGVASTMNIALNKLYGTVTVVLAETLVLMEKMKLEKSYFLQCLENGPMACPGIIDNAYKISKHDFSSVTTLKHIQNIMGLAIQLGHRYFQPLPITSVANDFYMRAMLRNYDNEDMTAVYKAVKY